MDIGTGNLDGYRVLDLTTEPGFLAARLLSDLGADVVKIEPPAGDPARRRGPFVGGVFDGEASIPWLAFNTGKRGITLDFRSPRGREILIALCRQADVVIESAMPGSPDSLGRNGLDYDTLHAKNPRLVVCALSPFGQTGPYRDYRASDITAVAMGGNMLPTGDPERAPVRCALPTAYYHAGLEAAAGIVFALWGRESTGSGQMVDVSIQESVVMANMTLAAQFPLTGERGRRCGAFFRGGRAIFREIWRCKDGHVSFALRGGPARIPGIQRMIAYMAEHGMEPDELSERDWSRYNHNLIEQEEVDRIEIALGSFFRTRTMRELFDAACRRGLMLAPANTAREVLASPQLAAREFFTEIEGEGLSLVLRYPGAFARTNTGKVGIRGPAPRLGEHNAKIYAGIGLDDDEQKALAARGII